MVTNNSYYLSIAQWLQTPNAQFIIGFIIVTIVILLMLLPVKWIFRIVVALFIIQAIIYVWFVAMLATVSHQVFITAFDTKLGHGAYQNILDAAKS